MRIFKRDDQEQPGDAAPAADAAGAPGAADPDASDAAGFQDAASEIKRLRPPKRKRGRPPKQRPTDEPAEPLEPSLDVDAAKRRVLSRRIPELVAKLYARGVDIVSLVVLAGMHIPSTYYVRADIDEDAREWAHNAIEESFELFPESAEKFWRSVTVYGLLFLHVGENVVAARERYLLALNRAPGDAGLR